MLAACFLTYSCGEPEPVALTVESDVPKDAQDVTFVDLEVIRGDAQLLEAADELIGALNRSLGNIGVGSSDLSRAVTFLMNGRRVIMVQGTFDLQDIGQRLEDTEHSTERVRDTEVWFGLAGNLAFLGPGHLAISDDFRSIEAMLNQLDDAQTFGAVEGVATVLDELQGRAYLSVTTQCEFVALGCRALGFSVASSVDASGSFDLISLFDSQEGAESGQATLEAFAMVETLFSGVSTRIEGPKFIASGDGNLSEIFRGTGSEFTLRP